MRHRWQKQQQDIMEVSLVIGARKKAEMYRTVFFEALKQEEGVQHDEQVSLESGFHRFVTSPDVIAYYCIIPLIGDILEKVKSQCTTDPELCRHFDSLSRETSNKCLPMKRLVKEVSTLLDEVVHLLVSLVDEELKRRDAHCDSAMFHDVLRDYWSRQRKQYLGENVGLERATRTYVMKELLGFNMGDKGEEYEERWYGAVWDYLSERDHYHMQIIARLEETHDELESLYVTMQNVVTYRSLVMLTMWRSAHQKGMRTITELLGYGSGESGDSDDNDSESSVEREEWTLAYGSFVRDYALFTRWHTHQLEGRQVHINLHYIDFDASRSSEAIHLDMAAVAQKESSPHHSPLSFASLFVHHHKEPLGLSYMASPSDLLALGVVVVQQQHQEEEVKSVKTRRGGIASLFTGSV